MVKRTHLNALCDRQGVVGAKVDVMDQDLDGLHADDGDQLGPVEPLVAVLCQTGTAWDDMKATLTAGNLNNHCYRGSFVIILITRCQQENKNEEMRMYFFFLPVGKLSSGGRLLMFALILVRASARVSPSTAFFSPSRGHKNNYKAGRKKNNEWGSGGQQIKKNDPWLLQIPRWGSTSA